MKSTKLKSFLPSFIRRPIGKLGAVARRLRIWGLVYARIKGVDDVDRKVLRQAFKRIPITVWQNIDGWQFPMVDEDCDVESRGVGLFKVRASTDDLFHVLPGQEPAVEKAIRDALRPGDTFVDAGSNIGFYSILAARLVGENGTVIACEMMPQTAAILRDHVEMNRAENISVFEGALSNTSGETVYASHPVGKLGQASIARSSFGSETSVLTKTLESILDKTDYVRIIKMDLEGAELNALRGLGPALDKIESVVFENRDIPEVVPWLQEHGFCVDRLDDGNALAQRCPLA